MIVFLASWFGLSLVAGVLWSLAASRGGIISESSLVSEVATVTPITRAPAGLRHPA